MVQAAVSLIALEPPAEVVDEATVPLLSIVVPTKNERDNVAALVERLEAALPTVAIEIIFVDDSDDGTRELVDALAEDGHHELVLVPQAPQRRICGLGAAVLQGMREARGPWVCVMDADLQHPPELIAALLEQGESRDLDIVVASRYCDDGDAGSFGWMRAMASRSTTTAAHMAFPRRLRGVSDPMSGFFLVRREALDLDSLRPRGFKILLEILVRHPSLRAAEVSFKFGERRAGRSKASTSEAMRYLGLLARLRFARFGIVGLSGLVVNTLLLAFFTDVIGLFYVVSAVIATQGSTLWNFCFTEAWVFSGRDHRRSRGTRMAMFFLMNNIALALRGPLLVLLTSGLGIHYVVSNVISLAGAHARPLRAGRHLDLGEGEPAGRPDVGAVLLRHPRHRLRLLRGPPPGARALPGRRAGQMSRTSGSAWAGSPRTATGWDPPFATARARAASDSGSMIHAGRQIEATASPLVGRSPHVLYTNVVEPILRWSFAERGYALVHAACLADRGRAFLLTARTDTGKTTTSLKILDSTAYSFLSDDLTLVTPQGRVLTYPKPLTISRHTLRAVKTPLLSRRERWGLVFQSRLHSRSGRRFAFVLAKTHLPAATINTIVQLLVPPPKFHVERLVPDVDVAVDARLAGMVVIERGGRGEAVLDEREALATLLSNCEDAYGFPPYSAIEGFLRSRNGMDLADREREIVAHALSGLPATLIRSDSMDWGSRLPGVVGAWNGHANGHADHNGHLERAPVHA